MEYPQSTIGNGVLGSEGALADSEDSRDENLASAPYPQYTVLRVSAMRHILVLVDWCRASNGAIDFSIGLAKRTNTDIVFFHSLEPPCGVGFLFASGAMGPDESIAQASQEECRACLQDAQERAQSFGVRATTIEAAGPPVTSIAAFLNERTFGVVVVGTHGRSSVEESFLGSTAKGVLRRANVPVFVVPTGPGARRIDGSAFGRIEVAFDGSAPSAAALRSALDLAEPGKTSLVLTHVLDFQSRNSGSRRNSFPVASHGECETAGALLAEAADRAKALGIAAESVLLNGPPLGLVLAVARSHGADLIALGVEELIGTGRRFLGSVADGVLRRSPVPVLVVPCVGASAAEAVS